MNARDRLDRVDGNFLIRSELYELDEARIARIEISASRKVIRTA
jgi:hypothetical protein